ncbi:MAG TPA: 3-oxoacyl-ACP reductase FabG [Thermoanaerobaculia bacterium]|nr:3-oxoacyl-ACP reductase FabG [Thermoanaerobaculia bacterium]
MIYTGQKALIVGASGGIGKAIARDVLENGGDVALTYRRNRQATDELLELAARHGRRAFAYELDVRDYEKVAATCQRIADELGVPTIVVCSSGIVRDRPLFEMDVADWQEVIDTNLNGTFYVLRNIVPFMIRQRQGRILTLASVSGLFGQPGQANYAASKGGIIAMTKVLARELGPFDISVNSIAPGVVETEIVEDLSEVARRRYLQRTPMRRFARTEDLLPATRLFLAPEGAYITGQVLVIDGGLTS